MPVLAKDLREAVLQAAIQGKLTEQLPADGSVEVLLKSIKNEKEKLVKEKKIKKEKSIALTREDIPFDIPANWKWCSISEVFTMQAGKAIPSIEIKTEKNESFKYPCFGGNGCRGYTKNYNKDGAYPIVGRQGALCGCINKAEGKFYATEHAVVVSYCAGMNVDFSCLFLKALNLNQYATATAQPGIAVSKIMQTPFPLPPIEEQQRIVDKVNELMLKIDEYEKIENQLIQLKKEFPGNMRDAILQAAMQGKLTEQLSTDSSIEGLLEVIIKEKQQLIKEGKIKKEKPIQHILEEEIPFDIPRNWRWVRIREVTYNLGQKKPDNDFYYVDVSSIDNQHNWLSKEINIIASQNASSRARKIINYGDVVFATIRPYLKNICIIDRKFDLETIASTAFAVMTCPNGINNKYLLYTLLSPMFMEYANRNDKSKGVAYPAISEKDFFDGIIPIPPIEEQERIVDKLDSLLPLIDKISILEE